MERRKVLVVDDEPRMRQLVSITLRNHGYRVFEAGNAEEALRAMEQEIPDAIVLDGMLPQKTGFELCSDLKGRPDTRQIPILLISGITQGVPGTTEAWKRRFLTDDYISKPFKLKDIVERVERLIEEASKRVVPA
jgi:two-component system phosphate regulon response regulator PhoB